jgi:hypothetical protein
MELLIEKKNLIIGGVMLIGGCVIAYLEPIAGALLSGAGGVMLQMRLETKAPDPLAKIRTKPPTRK